MQDSRRRPDGTAVVYAALSIVFLVSFGVSNNVSAPHSEAWPRAVCIASCVLLGAMVVGRAMTGGVSGLNIWVFGCLLYGALIAADGLIHAAALAQLPGSTRVNVVAMTAARWSWQNSKFALFYLCFPVLCVLQYLLVRRLSPRAITRVLCACMSVSFVCVAASRMVPGIVKPYWFMREGRFWGLLRTPNSYALAINLLLPWVVAAMFRRGGRVEKILYGCCLALALKGVLESGSRTGLAMALGFVALAPAVVAAAPTRSGQRARRALLAVLPPLVLGLTLGAIALARSGGSEGSGVLVSRVGQTLERLREGGVRGVFFLREARGFHALVAWLMMMRAPLAGWGPGGFYRQFPNAIFIATGRVRPATDSALNHYLMIGGDLGVPALAVHLFVLALPLCLGWLILRRAIPTEDRLLIRLLVLGSLVFLIGINFMPPSYFQDVLWLWAVQLAYPVAVARRHDLLPMPRGIRWRAALTLSAVAIVGATLVGAVTVTWGSLGYSAMQHADWWPWRYARNCYQLQRSPDGEGCWCANDAVLQIPYFGRPPDVIHLPISARHPDAKDQPVVVRYGGLSGTTQGVVFAEPSWRILTIPVTEEYLYNPTASRERHRWELPWIPPTAKSLVPRDIWYVVLSIEVSRTWVPEQWGWSGDSRELAVKVLVPEGRFERGCFHAERVRNGTLLWCSTDAVAQMPIPGIPLSSVRVGFGAFHPGIEDSSVIIRYGGLSGPTDSLVVTEKSWNRVRIPLTDDYLYTPADIHNPQWQSLLSVPMASYLETAPPREDTSYLILSLRTSRGWTPREWTAGGEAREVGLALLVPDFRSHAEPEAEGDDP
jgi:hypothetical protein